MLHDAKDILEIFKGKGWSLYKLNPSSDFPMTVSQGKAAAIELDVPYCLLPLTSKDDDVNDVGAHMANSNRTNQLPTYNDKTNPSGQIVVVMMTEEGLDIQLRGVQSCYHLNANQVKDGIKYNISNYNICYFDTIEELGEFLSLKNICEQTPTALPKQLRWEYVHADQTTPTKVTIYPSNPSPVLFRGQNRRYQPCHPTAQRGIDGQAIALHHLPLVEQASLILNLVRTEWFNENLRQTKAMRWMRQQSIVFDETAVAQHYGLPTGYIDLSQSFAVSSFFACCKYDSKRKVWQAVQDGEGVIYLVDISQLPLNVPAVPICLQPFPRPSEQWGWVHEMMLGQDFDTLPHVKKFIFKHDAAASQKILEQFSHGADLFPPDPLAEVADAVNQSRELPIDVAVRLVEDLINDPYGLPNNKARDVLSMVEREKEVVFSEAVKVCIMDDRITSEMNALWAQRKIPLAKGDGIGFRLTRTKQTDRKDD